MKQSLLQKIEAIKKMSSNTVIIEPVSNVKKMAKPDSLSMAIHSKKDADHFLAELKAIGTNI